MSVKMFEMSPHGEVADELDSEIVRSDLEFSLSYYVHFWTFTLGKV